MNQKCSFDYIFIIPPKLQLCKWCWIRANTLCLARFLFSASMKSSFDMQTLNSFILSKCWFRMCWRISYTNTKNICLTFDISKYSHFPVKVLTDKTLCVLSKISLFIRIYLLVSIDIKPLNKDICHDVKCTFRILKRDFIDSSRNERTSTWKFKQFFYPSLKAAKLLQNFK